MLQSTFSSKLLNLGQISTSTSPPGTSPHLPPISSLHSYCHLTCPPPTVPRHICARSLGSLCAFLRERRPLLLSLNINPPQDLNRLPYASLRSLRVNTLVHALLRVTHTQLSTGERHLTAANSVVPVDQ